MRLKIFDKYYYANYSELRYVSVVCNILDKCFGETMTKFQFVGDLFLF